MQLNEFTLEELRELLITTHKSLVSKDAVVKEQKEMIARLQAELILLKHQLFGSKSEKSSTLPEDNTLDEPKTPDKEILEKIEEADQEITVASHTRKKKKSGKRKPLPDNLPVVEIIHDLTEEEKKCSCGCQLQHITDETSDQLEIIPVQLYIVRHVRRKYANCKNKCNTTIKIAPMPKLPLPKSIAAPGLLAHVITSKYEDHLPLYRQENILQRLGIDIPRQTISSWVVKAYKLLIPLYALMMRNICTYDVAFADETTLQVIKEKDKTVQSKSYMWVIGGGSVETFSYIFRYSSSRSHEVLYELLDGFSGYLHCDGYPGYDLFAKKQGKKDINIIQVGCWYHARRKFIEAAKTTKSPGVSKWIINRIAKLSKIESNIKELSTREIHEARQTKSTPILNEIKEKLDSIVSITPEKSKLGEAVNYTLNQWPKLINYTDDGRLEISNNRMEREIKPFATGRKNWLFSYCVEGAICSAVYFSFQSTCKYHGVNFYLWLKYIFSKIPSYPEDKLSDLLPYSVDPILLEESGKIPEFTSPQNIPVEEPPDTC